MRIKKPHAWDFVNRKAAQITKNPLFRKQIIEIREKWDIPRDGFVSFGDENHKGWEKYIYELDKKADHEGLYHQFTKDVIGLRFLFHLSDYWSKFIEHYILFNQIPNEWPMNTYISGKENKETGETEIYLRIFEHTRLPDIQAVWNDVMQVQTLIPGFIKANRSSDPRIFERDLYILKLNQEGNSPEEIAKATQEHFISENASDEEFKKLEKIYCLQEAAIRQVISRMKRKLKL